MYYSFVLEEVLFDGTPIYCRGLFRCHMRQFLDHSGECLTHHHRSPSATARPFGGIRMANGVSSLYAEQILSLIVWKEAVLVHAY